MTVRRMLHAGVCILMTLSIHGAWAESVGRPDILTAPADRRGEEQTFLTFPEWFLVFSPAEYAVFVRNSTPDEFCFWGHIGQFWRAYSSVIHETTSRHEPTNWGYHAMIVVIGVSTTVEYAMRSAYETLIGRVSAATLSNSSRTAEDEFAAREAQAYVDFIRVRPWYEFDFLSRLEGLWTQTDFLGPHMIRKWERKYALTTEYAVKAAYGWLIGIGTRSAYDPVIPTTSVAVARWPLCEAIPPEVTRLSAAANGETLLSLPRYEPFRAPLLALANCGADIREIAGNRSIIVVSVIGATNANPPLGSTVMMRQPILTQPGRERMVLIVPITHLAVALAGLSSHDLALEHVFDY